MLSWKELLEKRCDAEFDSSDDESKDTQRKLASLASAPIEGSLYYGVTPLHLAAYWGKAEAARALLAAGAAFVGPSAHAIRAMGDKIESKRLAAEALSWAIPSLEAKKINAQFLGGGGEEGAEEGEKSDDAPDSPEETKEGQKGVGAIVK